MREILLLLCGHFQLLNARREGKQQTSTLCTKFKNLPLKPSAGGETGQQTARVGVGSMPEGWVFPPHTPVEEEEEEKRVGSMASARVCVILFVLHGGERQGGSGSDNHTCRPTIPTQLGQPSPKTENDEDRED